MATRNHPEGNVFRADMISDALGGPGCDHGVVLAGNGEDIGVNVVQSGDILADLDFAFGQLVVDPDAHHGVLDDAAGVGDHAVEEGGGGGVVGDELPVTQTHNQLPVAHHTADRVGQLETDGIGPAGGVEPVGFQVVDAEPGA